MFFRFAKLFINQKDKTYMKQNTEKTSTITIPATLIARIKLHCCIKGLKIKVWAVKALETVLTKEGGK